jgi:hypothetical protein
MLVEKAHAATLGGSGAGHCDESYRFRLCIFVRHAEEPQVVRTDSLEYVNRTAASYSSISLVCLRHEGAALPCHFRKVRPAPSLT